MSADSTVRSEPDATVSSPKLPTVSIILPVLNEKAQLERCLSAVAEQSYPAINEVVVADGGSTDETRSVVSKFAKVRVVDNPRGIRPAGLNTAIGAASGDIIVRVDARTAFAPDYVERCVAALESSGAAIVGGQMRYEAHDARQRGIVAAMTSRLGAGPAAFRREGGHPRYVDTGSGRSRASSTGTATTAPGRSASTPGHFRGASLPFQRSLSGSRALGGGPCWPPTWRWFSDGAPSSSPATPRRCQLF